MTKFTVTAVDYPEHKPVTTEGTQADAIRAFLVQRGLNGLNLELNVLDEKGVTVKVSQAQCAEVVAKAAAGEVPPVMAAVSAEKEADDHEAKKHAHATHAKK